MEPVTSKTKTSDAAPSAMTSTSLPVWESTPWVARMVRRNQLLMLFGQPLCWKQETELVTGWVYSAANRNVFLTSYALKSFIRIFYIVGLWNSLYRKIHISLSANDLNRTPCRHDHATVTGVPWFELGRTGGARSGPNQKWVQFPWFNLVLESWSYLLPMKYKWTVKWCLLFCGLLQSISKMGPKQFPMLVMLYQWTKRPHHESYNPSLDKISAAMKYTHSVQHTFLPPKLKDYFKRCKLVWTWCFNDVNHRWVHTTNLVSMVRTGCSSKPVQPMET